jgi:hypothetical protein
MNTDIKKRLEKALSQRLYLISAKNNLENEWNFEVEDTRYANTYTLL